MTNEVSIVVSVNDDTKPGLEKVVTGSRAGGIEAGTAFSEGLQAGMGDSLSAQASATVAQLAARTEPEAAEAGAGAGLAYSDAFKAALASGTFSFGQLMSMGEQEVIDFAGTLATEAAPAMEAAASEVGAAFVSSFDGVVYEGLAYSAVASGAVDQFAASLTAESELAGDQAGTAFSVAYSAAANRGLAIADAGATLAPALQQLGIGSGSAIEANAGKVASALSSESEAAGAAEKSFGGLASVMGGPWSYGLMNAAFLLPMVTQWLGNAGQQTNVFTQAVTQDSGAVGDNTAATIQNMLAKSDLNSMAQVLGVSQAQLIEYAAGEADAQDQVTAAYKRVDAYQQLHTSNAVAGLQAQKQQLDAMTSSVAAAIEQEHEQTDTLIAAENSANIFDAAMANLHSTMLAQAQSSAMSTTATLGLDTGQTALNKSLSAAADAYNVANAQATAYSTVLAALGTNSKGYLSASEYLDVFQTTLDETQPKIAQQALSMGVSAAAALDLGDNQAQLNLTLSNAVDRYSLATGGAAGYNTILTALNGTTENLLGSEASFTIALDGVAKAAQSNGLSLDVNNVNGAKNVQTFTQVAQAAQKAADAVYENEVATKGSVIAYNDANAKLEQEKQAFEAAAEKAGFSKTKVQELADELFKLPPDVKVDVNADTSAAYDGVRQMVEYFDHQVAYVQVYATANGLPGGKQLLASGGAVGAAASGGVHGNLVEVGEQGAELVRLPVGASVVPHSNVNAMAASGALGGWDGRLQVEWVGAPDPALDALWTALRGHIRFRAGTGPNSVQTALGQGT
jgi:hypothetical protein